MNALFDILVKPFSSLSPLWGLMWISAIAGIAMILIFKKTSNQQAIAGLRRKMASRALGMLLYLESPLTVLKLASGLIMDNFIYLWHLLRPMLIIALPFVVTAAQLDARYGKLPPSSDRPSTVTVRWENAIPETAFSAPDAGMIVSPVVTVADSLEQSFSFTGANGVFIYSDHGIRVGSAGGSGSIIVRGSEKGGVVSALLHPWNSRVQNGMESVHASLQPASYSILGGRWSWFAVFLVFSSLWAVIGTVVFKVKV